MPLLNNFILYEKHYNFKQESNTLGVKPDLLTNKAGHAKVIRVKGQGLYAVNKIDYGIILPV